MMKHARIEPILPHEPAASAKKFLHPKVIALASKISGFYQQAIVFSVAFLIVFSRRPDVILNAQFYAEDGRVWWLDAYNLGLHSLFMPQADYLQTLSRTVALISLLFPLSQAPLVMNLCAIVVQILPVNLFLSSRFSGIPLKTRLLGSLMYLALPNAAEVHANITNGQWHLGLLACLVLLARPASGWGWRIFDGVVLVLTSISSPIGILLVPLAALLWWKRRLGWSALSVALLFPGALLAGLMALLSHGRQEAPIGPTLSRFAAILGRQVFLSSILGRNTQDWLLQLHNLHLVEGIATVVGLAVLLYALRYGQTELRLFVLFAYAELTLALIKPLAGAPDRPQWEWLGIPGCGERYYFMPMLAFLASLVWMASRRGSPRAIRSFAVALLLLFPIGVYQDWNYPPLRDLDFSRHAAEFEQAPAGTKIVIPINPRPVPWNIELTKH
jgi:hypothetical protein